MDAWQRMEKDVTQAVVDAMCGEGEKPAHVLFTGHSLGGALATLASFSIVETLVQRNVLARDRALVYTFGAPRVGNEAFVDEYMRRAPVTYRVTVRLRTPAQTPSPPPTAWSHRPSRAPRRAPRTPSHWPRPATCTSTPA